MRRPGPFKDLVGQVSPDYFAKPCLRRSLERGSRGKGRVACSLDSKTPGFYTCALAISRMHTLYCRNIITLVSLSAYMKRSRLLTIIFYRHPT